MKKDLTPKEKKTIGQALADGIWQAYFAHEDGNAGDADELVSYAYEVIKIAKKIGIEVPNDSNIYENIEKIKNEVEHQDLAEKEY